MTVPKKINKNESKIKSNLYHRPRTFTLQAAFKYTILKFSRLVNHGPSQPPLLTMSILLQTSITIEIMQFFA